MPKIANKCDSCDKIFSENSAFRKHILNNHKNYKPRKNFFNDPDGCKFEQGCHFSHVPVPADKHRCYRCGSEFDSIATLMNHRKRAHKARCKDAIENKCRFNQNTCYLDHLVHTAEESRIREQDFLVGFPPLPPGPKITNKDKLPTAMDPNKDPKHQILQKILEMLQTLIQ